MALPTVDYTYLTSIFPELANIIPSAVVDALNPIGALWVAESVFGTGDRAKYALALSIAHEFTLGQRLGGGPVTSDKIGDLATAYAALPVDKGHLQQTTYGQRLWQQIRIARPGGIVTNASGPADAPGYSGPQPTWTYYTTQVNQPLP